MECKLNRLTQSPPVSDGTGSSGLVLLESTMIIVLKLAATVLFLLLLLVQRKH